MHAQGTALSTAAVKREIRKIVARNGHKLGPFDTYDSAECSHCRAIMALEDAHAALAGDTDALGCFTDRCPQDDPAELILWFARLLRDGEAIAVPGLDVWVARMLKALQFYADPATYEQATPTTGPFSTGSALPIHEDRGERARAALDEKSAREAKR